MRTTNVHRQKNSLFVRTCRLVPHQQARQCVVGARVYAHSSCASTMRVRPTRAIRILKPRRTDTEDPIAYTHLSSVPIRASSTQARSCCVGIGAPHTRCLSYRAYHAHQPHLERIRMTNAHQRRKVPMAHTLWVCALRLSHAMRMTHAHDHKRPVARAPSASSAHHRGSLEGANEHPGSKRGAAATQVTSAPQRCDVFTGASA